MLIKLNDIYPTIQGEGAMTGTPMFLVRTMGCDVGCDFCDTKESWYARPDFKVNSIGELLKHRKNNKLFWTEVETADIVNHICTSRYCTPYDNIYGVRGIRWVLLTGGEPALQSDAVDDLITLLHIQEFKVAIETSGARYIPPLVLSKLDWICVSPKIMGNRFSNFDPVFVPYTNEFKFVVTNIGNDGDFHTIFCFLDKYRDNFKDDVRISIQPMSNDPQILNACIEVCLHSGFHLSLQTHKFINLK